jgi:acyl carrier protein
MVSVQKIVEIIGSAGVVPDMTKFDPEKTFKQNGIDSLDVFTVFLAIEETLGVHFSEEVSTSIKSAQEIVDYLNLNN